MSQNPIIQLNRILLEEEGLFRQMKKTPPGVRLAAKRSELAEFLRAIGQSGNPRLIIAVEKVIVEGDQERYANSRRMRASLNAAHDELEAIERHLDWVADVDKYHFIHESHALRKTRKGALPLDDARLALASHSGRLANMDKTRLDEEEKAIIDTRKANVDTVGSIYIALQVKALVTDAPPQS